jgi:tetratricopeptide (TPR) repeat protein
MAEAGPGSAGGYVAFISYSHRDAAIGRWLHSRLESYRLPKRLAGTEGEDGTVPARLTPIFRDRDELPAAGDLSEKVRAALAVSKNLIVVCSPNSAASPWVAKEITTFRELHPDRPIFTAIVEGEPDQCFPPVLREGGVEPLAADLRKEGDGRRLGLLKLVAGLAGVGLDALVQRDAARRVRRVGYLTAVAMAAMLVMAFLTAFALSARGEAERQRGEAEGMVEFMITDLRKDLQNAGNLKILDAANQRALDYYRHQDLTSLSPESLERRARILHNMGEDDIARDKLDRALARFREAAATTARLLAETPDDPDRIFNQAQSEFWIGNVAYDRGDKATARQGFERYLALARRLMAVAPADPRGRQELSYAQQSVCAIALEERNDPDGTVAICRASLATMLQVAGTSKDPDVINSIANRSAWLADAYRMRGEDNRAWSLRLRQEQLLEELLKRDTSSFKYREAWVTSQFSIAELEMARGERKAARERLRRALLMVEDMTRRDPSNKKWASRKQRIERDLRLLQAGQRPASAR